jgi:hypothetical protein
MSICGPRRRARALLLVVAVAQCLVATSAAQSTVPAAPEVILRDTVDGITVRATRTDVPIRIDGRLDEPMYATVRVMSDFIQTDPQPGQPATEKTDVWLMFDDAHIYVSVRCWETQPDRRVANEMRRDSPGVSQGNDNIAFMFDTFHDRRNAVTFAVNSLGGRNDGQVTNQRQYNADWNPVWDVKAGHFEGGWTFEAAIPFKSLRYGPGEAQTWGFNVVRTVRWRNETSYLSKVPESIAANAGIMYSSYAATMVGLQAPPGSRNIEVKPYVTASLSTDRVATPRVSNDPEADVGIDAKYGLTQNLTADLTLNTDFAQVEADQQQVNLTRFNLFFPEKREFFLENQGVFAFGGTGTSGGAGDTPILFYSRRIGLSRGVAVPIAGGGRLTGRVGRFTLGLLNIHSRDEPAAQARSTNFSVLRVKRDILRKSSIGALVTHRSLAQAGVGTNDAYGVDGSFAFFDNIYVNSYWARTRSDGGSGRDVSYRAQFDYAADRYGVQLERLVVGSRFNPDIGFVRRTDIGKTSGQFRFSPRMANSKTVRKLTWTGSVGYIHNGTGRLDTRDVDGLFSIDFENSDRFSAGYHGTYEFLPQPFRIAPGVVLPVGGYDYHDARASFTFGPQRPVFGTVAAEYGTFYDGHRTTVRLSGGRAKLMTRLSVEPSFSINRVDLPQGRFTTRLVGSRVTFTATPSMFTSAFLQYNSSNSGLGANVRFRWEYQAGSELFIVYNEQRDTDVRTVPGLLNRSFIVKVNRLFRF